MKSKKRILVTICAVALIITSFGVIGASAASELMDANLNGKFHYVPILKDPMEASTYYGHGNDNATAQCNTSVKAYNGAGEYNSSATIYRYGWDSISGEGSDGPCRAKASIRACHKGVSTHKGYAANRYGWETVTLTVKNPNI